MGYKRLVDAFSICIQRWAAWVPGIHSREEWTQWAQGKLAVVSGEGPDVKQIPAMLRRRLSPLGKMALSVAWELLPSEAMKMPAIFASRHGELERTVGMLKALAGGEALSPTQFSLSVHNAVSGVFSIARKDTHPITALAIDKESPSLALLEAAMILQERDAEQVLCVIYDEPLPEPYAGSNPGEGPNIPYAAAFVLAQDIKQGGSKHLLSLGDSGHIKAENEDMPILGLLRYLISESKTLELPGFQHRWRWQRER